MHASVNFDLSSINQIVQSSQVVRKCSVAWSTRSAWTWCPVTRTGTLLPPFSGTTRAKPSMRLSLSTEGAVDYMWPKLRISWETAHSSSTSALNVSDPTREAESCCLCTLKMRIFFFFSETPFPDAPSLSCNHSYEVAENDELQNVCKLEALPRPIMSWSRDGKKLESSHQWKKEDSGYYFFTATNKHREVGHELYIDVLCMFQHSVFPKRSSSVPLSAQQKRGFPAVALTRFLALVCRCSTVQHGQFHRGSEVR